MADHTLFTLLNAKVSTDCFCNIFSVVVEISFSLTGTEVIVNTLDSTLSGLCSSLCCVLGKDTYSHSLSLSTQLNTFE